MMNTNEFRNYNFIEERGFIPFANRRNTVFNEPKEVAFEMPTGLREMYTSNFGESPNISHIIGYEPLQNLPFINKDDSEN